MPDLDPRSLTASLRWLPLMVLAMVACAGCRDAATPPAAQPPVPAVSAARPSAPAPAVRLPAVAGPSWQAAGWGGGGHFYACAFHPLKDGVLYLGGDVNGFYKSEDRGLHWRICNRGLGNYKLITLAVDPLHPDRVYAGTAGGVCRSDDAGESWTFLPRTAPKELAITSEPYQSVRPLAVDPLSGALFAGTVNGRILRSDDAGDAWKQVFALSDKGSIASLTIGADGLTMFAATSVAGILRSGDGGLNWVAVGKPRQVRHVAIAASDPRIVYAACAGDGVWRSGDGGMTWAAVDQGAGSVSAAIEIIIDPRDADHLGCIAAERWKGVYARSQDGGKSWSRTRSLTRDLAADPTLPNEGGAGANGIPFSAINNIAMDPHHPEQLFVAGNWRNAFSADGGATWAERVRGADISCVTDIRFLDGTTYVTVMDEGLLTSPDHGATWRQLAPLKWSKELSGHQWRVLPQKLADGTVRIVTTSSPWDDKVNRVLVSGDGGAHFSKTMDGLPATRPAVNCMWGEGYARALAGDPTDPRVLYLGIDGDPEPATGFAGGGIFTSTDGGTHWLQLPNQPASRRMFYGLAVDPTAPKRLFWGACGVRGGLYRSEDGGGSWQLVMKDEPWVFNVLVTSTGTIYCPGKNLWRSTDHGATWTRITDYSDGKTIVGLEVNPADERTIWLSRVVWGGEVAGQIVKTADGGTTWQDITGDIPHRRPLVLRFDPSTAELWAGNVGLYKLKQ